MKYQSTVRIVLAVVIAMYLLEPLMAQACRRSLLHRRRIDCCRPFVPPGNIRPIPRVPPRAPSGEDQ